MQKIKRSKNTYGIQYRIILTLTLLILSRFGTFIPVPGVDHDAFYQSISNNPIASFLNIFSGGGFASIGIFALGIVPYINASIVIQLATSSIPTLEKLQKEEGESGRQRISQITRYLALCWSIIQSLGVSFWVRPYVFNWDTQFILEMTLSLTTGSMLIMWISEQITEKGIGNGASVLIFVNIISGLPKLLQQSSSIMKPNETLLELIVLAVIFLGMIVGIIFVQEGTRRIPIVSARQLGKGQLENKTSYLPLRLNQGGVMPIIFASAFLVLPAYISQITKNNLVLSLTNALSPVSGNKTFYLLFYFILILFFSYFYASLVLNPSDVSKNLKKMESSIPGIRPGKATEDYLQKTLNRLTFLGALFLAFIAVIPSIIENLTGISTFKGLGATSLLILVGVAIDTSKQIQTYLISKNYENIMK
jgi:preprotein translocase subunit SecY